MCKVQTQLYDLLRCNEEEFLSKIDSLDRNQIELLVKNIKLNKNSNNSLKKENEYMK